MQKITFFQKSEKKHQFFQKIRRKKMKKILKKCYPLSFPILVILNSTRALQSSPFQNPGGVPWAWHSPKGEGRTKEILVYNIGFISFFKADYYSVSTHALRNQVLQKVVCHYVSALLVLQTRQSQELLLSRESLEEGLLNKITWVKDILNFKWF